MFILSLIVALAGCAKPPPMSALERGRTAYTINCASCHGTDPRRDGPIGPAIADSSRALIAARVLHAAYPPGYHPKRATHLMRAMPWVAPQLDNLTAYLQAAH